ncbi:MAG TPA: thioesterase family protein [Puia sp.]|nr:thioesterase family protein [Puia sp.]
MPRIKIDLPGQFSFTTVIPVRITDLNYGGHVGNDSVLSLLHEARVQFLRHYGYGELNLAGVGIIMGDVAIEFKKEIFYGDILRVSVTAGEFSSVGFTLFYKIERESSASEVQASDSLLVTARTGMVCYDYAKKKVAPVPGEVIAKLAPPPGPPHSISSSSLPPG